MERSALFFDIDGTLLSEITQEIPQSAVRALEQARRNGHLLLINTGRTICSIPAEIRRLPIDGFLCGCGIYAELEDQVIFERHLDAGRGEAIARKAAECMVDAVYEGRDDIYFSARISRFDGLENTRRYMNNRGLGLERAIEQGDCPYDKLFAYVDERSRREEFFRFLEEDMEIIDRGNRTYECAMKGYSKGTILEAVLEKTGIARKNAYVFGDSGNDMAMFRCGAHTIAMGAHDPVLDPFTEYVAPTVEEDGIWRALAHYGLL